MNLKTLLKLKPGTLIKGCKVLNSDDGLGRVITPSVHGWSVSKDYNDAGGRWPPPKQYVFFWARDLDDLPVIKTCSPQDYAKIGNVALFGAANYEAYECYSKFQPEKTSSETIVLSYGKPVGMLFGEYVIVKATNGVFNTWGIYIKMLVADKVVWLQALTIRGPQEPQGDLDLL